MLSKYLRRIKNSDADQQTYLKKLEILGQDGQPISQYTREQQMLIENSKNLLLRAQSLKNAEKD